MCDWETLHIAFKLTNISGLHPQNLIKPLAVFNFVILTIVTTLVITNTVVNYDLAQLEAVSYIYYIWIKFGGVLLLRRQAIKKMLVLTKKFKSNDFLAEHNEIFRKYISWLKYYVAFIALCYVLVLYRSLASETRTIFGTYLPKGVPRRALYFVELYTTLFSSSSIAGASVLATTLLLSVGQQLDFVNRELKGLDLVLLGTPEGKRGILKRLKETIAYHIFLLKCVNQLNEMLSLPLLMQLIGDVYVLCISMYGISSPDSSLVDVIRCVVISFEIMAAFVLLFALPSQILTDMSEKIGESIYCHCAWYIPSIVLLRKDLLLVLTMSQKPLTISAGGFTEVNNRTLLFLLKTAYSFYTFMQTVS